MKITYALSAQAKGKIERPYGWLQDRLIRTCVREDVQDLQEAQKILTQEVRRYNHHQVHSTTQEIPARRLQAALQSKQSLFREFTLPPPYRSAKDVFCLRLERTIDSYRRISLNNLQLKVNHATPGKTVTLKIYPLSATLSEVRFWCEETLLDIQKIKSSELKGVHF